MTLTRKGERLFVLVAPAYLANEADLIAALTSKERETLAMLRRKVLLRFEGSTEIL